MLDKNQTEDGIKVFFHQDKFQVDQTQLFQKLWK